MLEVTQSARDATADFVADDPEFFIDQDDRDRYCTAVRNGEADAEPLVQAFTLAEQRGRLPARTEPTIDDTTVITRLNKLIEALLIDIACLKKVARFQMEGKHRETAEATLWFEKYQELRTETTRKDELIDALRHWSVGHIDALLLYAVGEYPNNSHVGDAVAFCRLVAPKFKLRMDPLKGSDFHPAGYILGHE